MLQNYDQTKSPSAQHETFIETTKTAHLLQLHQMQNTNASNASLLSVSNTTNNKQPQPMSWLELKNKKSFKTFETKVIEELKERLHLWIDPKFRFKEFAQPD